MHPWLFIIPSGLSGVAVAFIAMWIESYFKLRRELRLLEESRDSWRTAACDYAQRLDDLHIIPGRPEPPPPNIPQEFTQQPELPF